MQRRQSSFAAWPALGAAAAGVVLFGALAHVLEPVAAAALPPLLLGGPPMRGCESCGWIEAKRELAPLGAADPHALRVYEYTLRMQDGSTSLFQETLPTSWRVGERIMLIEAAGALD
jgi:hypothetical protein